MIFGIGTDRIEVERIEKWIARGQPYRDTIFTEKAIEYGETQAIKSEQYPVRYPAKEATLQALGAGWRAGPAVSDLEVINDELGKPQVFLPGQVKAFLSSIQSDKPQFPYPLVAKVPLR